jgi:hypothetical protein
MEHMTIAQVVSGVGFQVKSTVKPAYKKVKGCLFHITRFV